MDKEFKRYETQSLSFIPGRLTKDPVIKHWDAKVFDDKTLPARDFIEVTVCDSPGGKGDYYKDVFVTAQFDISKNPKSVLKKLRKGDFIELRGKVKYRTYESNGETRVTGDMPYPKDFVLAPGEWADRQPIDAGEANEPSGKEEKLPW